MSTAATSNLLYRLSEPPEGTRLAFTHTVVGPFPEEPSTEGGFALTRCGSRVIATVRGARRIRIGQRLYTTGRAVYVQGRVHVLWADFFINSGPGLRCRRPADLPRDVRVLTYSQSFVNSEVVRSQMLAGSFFEDTFRATGDLTAIAGLRWDYDSAMSWTPRGGTRHFTHGGYGIFYERIPFAVYSDTGQPCIYGDETHPMVERRNGTDRRKHHHRETRSHGFRCNCREVKRL